MILNLFLQDAVSRLNGSRGTGKHLARYQAPSGLCPAVGFNRLAVLVHFSGTCCHFFFCIMSDMSPVNKMAARHYAYLPI